jgi:hypothetical protein
MTNSLCPKHKAVDIPWLLLAAFAGGAGAEEGGADGAAARAGGAGRVAAPLCGAALGAQRAVLVPAGVWLLQLPACML